jgi:hypothetical protein
VLFQISFDQESKTPKSLGVPKASPAGEHKVQWPCGGPKGYNDKMEIATMDIP